MLDDLVNLARSESLSFLPSTLDLRAWFEGVSTRGRALAEGKGLKFESKYRAAVNSIVFDVHRLTQCVDNLLSNAVRYTDRGNVKLIVCCARIPNSEGEATLAIRVIDTGRGIQVQDQARIFEPFVRLESTVAGMGVGLSMVAGLARRVDGSVTVKSAPGKGSRFSFIVPRVRLSEEEARYAASDASKPRRTAVNSTSPVPVLPDRHSGLSVPKVLVVDDDEVILLVISKLLPLMGFEAEIARGGEVGLTLALSGDYCAVLTDIQMPGLDGFQLAGRLRSSLNPCPTLIAMTAYTATPTGGTTADVFDALLRKPIDEGELLNLLDQAATRWLTGASGR
jgi:CheY-like chemotaxis protein